MYCSKCGTKQNEGEKFCPNCGTKFEGVISTSIEPAVTTSNEDVQLLQSEQDLQRSVGVQFEKETYTSKNITDTNSLIEKAKEGNIPALLRLAFRYENGLGVRQNEAKAEELYKEVENRGFSKDFVDLSFFEEISVFKHCNLEGVSIVPPVKYTNMYREDSQTGGICIKYYIDSWKDWKPSLPYEVKKYNENAKSYGFNPLKLTYVGDRVYIVEGSFTSKKTSFWGEIFGTSAADSIKKANFQMKKAFDEICELCEKYKVTYTVSAEKVNDADKETVTTFVYIKDLLLEYADRIKRNPTSKESVNIWFVSKIRELQNRFPQLLYTLCSPDIELKDAITYMENIKKKVQNCYYPIIPNYYANGFMDFIDNKLIQTSNYFKLRYFSSVLHECTIDKLDIFLLSILLSIPIKKIKLTIINLEKKIDTRFWTAYINPKVYRIITIEDELNEFVDSLKKEILIREQKYKDFSRYCLENKEIPEKYEIVIMDYSTISLCKELKNMKEEGLKKGVYILNLTSYCGKGNNSLFNNKTNYVKNREDENIKYNYEKKGFFMRCTPLMKNKNLLHACINYINEEADAKDEMPVIICDFKSLAKNVYEKTSEMITIPVGKSEKEVNFRMDLVNHVHSFIIGQSGSGKSVFLHNIIGSTILKYAPEDLQLYLLDFKLGGVEFNRYRGIKHVKSLLVDNSDQQITLEILRELRDSMTERGKQLRDAGVSNLAEYNKMYPTRTMPQILIIVDECHEMFRVGNDIPRSISYEITEIVTKIAKEGRSQGVHLVLATQTLSGTEISNEILNNISDHYLLKCALSDSEHLVDGSSEITSKLTTGQIYYHHIDGQIQFQAYYTDKQNAEKLIELAKEKAEGHKSNGEFYFNGSQLFKLNISILEQNKPASKYLTTYVGKNISIRQNDISIKLREDYGENILLLGLNDEEQVTRTTMNLFVSLLFAARNSNRGISFKVLNCLPNEDSIYFQQLERLEEEGFCEIIEGRKNRGTFLKQLAEDISNETAKKTILIILGQERFRELKMDWEINESQKLKEDDAFGLGNFSFSNEGSSTQINTFKQAMETILDKGPEQGVHIVMQLDKPSNFLFSDYVTPKMVFEKFKHLVMLRSEETASATLHLNDNIRLETLSKDTERLRAYYYAEESDSYTLFTPYQQLSDNEIMGLLK